MLMFYKEPKVKGKKIINESNKLSEDFVNANDKIQDYSKEEWIDAYKKSLRLDYIVAKSLLLREKELQKQSNNMRIRMLFIGVMLIFAIPKLLNQINNNMELCTEQNENIFYMVISLYFATCVAADKIVSSINQRTLDDLSSVKSWREILIEEDQKNGVEIPETFNNLARL